MNWIVVLVIIVIAVVSAIAQTIKNQQEKEQLPRRRPNARANAGGVKTGSSDMDRFLQEIEKLRKRAADGEDEPKKQSKSTKQNRSVPTIAPKRKVSAPTVKPSRRIEDLPTATVVSPPPPATPINAYVPELPPPISDSQPLLSDRPTISKTPKHIPKTPFGKNLQAMLENRQNMPLAIVLQEILGPPKCQRGS